jgi:hypothetical protein
LGVVVAAAAAAAAALPPGFLLALVGSLAAGTGYSSGTWWRDHARETEAEDQLGTGCVCCVWWVLCHHEGCCSIRHPQS